MMKTVLEEKQRRIIALEVLIESNTDFLKNLKNKLQNLSTYNESNKKVAINGLVKTIEIRAKFDYDFNLLIIHFEEVHPNFTRQLYSKNPLLTYKDVQVLSLIKLGFTNKDIAILQNISDQGIKKSIQRIRKKIGLGEKKSIRAYLKNF